MSLSNTEIMAALQGLNTNWFSDESTHYSETYQKDDPEDIPTDKLEPHNYKDLRVLQDGLMQLIAHNEGIKQLLELQKEELHQKGIDEQTAIEQCENAEEQVEELTENLKLSEDKVCELTHENKELSDFDNWENHPALKHKVVLDEDFYQQHTDDDGELIDPDEHADAVNTLDCMTRFVAGDGSMQDEVEEHLKEIYSKEFIKGNTETWKEVGLFDEEDTTCDFCENQRCHLVKRDAGYDEWTCDKCHKEQYPTED